MINYFHQGFRPALYWVNTSGNSILAELLRHADPKQEQELQELLEGKSIHAKIDEGIIYQDIHENRDALYTLLLTTGYLTTATPPTIRHTWMVAELRIPNHEIRCVYAAEILRRIGRMNGAPDLTRLLDALLDGRANTFAKGLAHYLETLASYYDTTNHETFYHGFLLGLLAMLVPEYTVRSNRESGYGRFDIAVFPKKNQSPGILMEFKVAGSETDLPAKARDALAQIEEMDYLAEFRAQGVDEV